MVDVTQAFWGLLPDDALENLGARDNVLAASKAIRKFGGYWLGSKGDGLVIAHEKCLSRTANDGVTYEDQQGSHLAEVAFSGPGQRYTTAERLAAGLGLLSGRQEGRPDVDGGAAWRAQCLVSSILVQHPVLLHPRLVIPLRRGRYVEYMPTLAALLATRIAALPSQRHGISLTEMTRFSGASLINAPLVLQAPKRAWVPNDSSVRRRKEVSAPGKAASAAMTVVGLPEPTFVASVLEIQRLRGCNLSGMEPRYHLELLRAALPRALGLHHHRGLAGIQQMRPCHAFLEELKLAEAHRDQAFIDSMAQPLVEAVLVKWLSPRSTWEQGASAHLVRENMAFVLAGLVASGLAEDRRRAATWLFTESLSPSRARDRALPEATIEGAMGLLQGLADAGVEPGDMPPNEDGPGLAKSLVGNVARWEIAHGIVARERAMSRVLSSAAPQAEKPETARRARAL